MFGRKQRSQTKPDPCRDRPWQTIVEEWKTIAEWLGWGILESGVAGPDHEEQTFTQIARTLAEHGFRPFPWYKPNLNREHVDGYHFEGLLGPGQWYHVIVYPARTNGDVAEDFRARPASGIEIHCERRYRRPSSIRHALDVILSKDFW
jgi:hypothetical protein